MKRIARPVEWRPIPSHKGLYSITRDGRVWAHERTAKHKTKGGVQVLKAKWLKEIERIEQGYLYVWLCDPLTLESRNGKQYAVHQLVLAAWGPPRPSSKHIPNHRDLNKQNNHIDNLEWVTYQENAQHAVKNGRVAYNHAKGSRSGKTKFTEATVYKIRRRYANGETVTELAREFNITGSGMSEIVHRHTWRHI